MIIDTIFLMAQSGGEGSGLANILMLGAMGLVFYFFMIRPQMKKQKEQKNFRSSISKGDKVVTVGGIHGRVSDAKEKTLIIDVDNGVKLKVERSAVSAEYTGGSGEDSTLAEKK